MADEQEPEVIRRQMQAQRAALDQKLDRLENRIVQTVEDAREAVADTIQTVKDSVQSSVETVRDTVQTSVHNVKETLDVKRQVERHPWGMVGGSIAVGFVIGWLTNRATRNAQPSAAFLGHAPPPYHRAPTRFQEELGPATEFTHEPSMSRPERTPPPRRSWVDDLTEKFAPEIQKAKGLAIGAGLGLLREVVSQAVPDQLRPRVSEIMDDITTKLGGEPLKGDLLEGLLPEHHNGHHRAREEEVTA